MILNECNAEHECRHDTVAYMARTISFRDLVEQVIYKLRDILRVQLFHPSSGSTFNSIAYLLLPKSQLLCLLMRNPVERMNVHL